jgi:Holliday junction resolvasome RuvABC ATP-dependent DNA helicase subunit
MEAIQDFIGDSLLGQDKLKNKLNFYINNQQKTGYLPFLMFHASRGSGKTTAARVLARNLKNHDDSKRRAIELNGVSLQSVSKFVDEILVPYVGNEQEITIFIDEVAECSDKVIAFLLSVLQPDINNRSSIEYQGNIYDFNFHYFNLICATTNGEKLREAFKSRFKKIEIEPYSEQSLIKILYKNSEEIQYLDGVEREIVSIARESPREIVLISKDVKQYANHCNSNTFSYDDWNNFVNYFDIKPYGCTIQEIELLKYLATGPKTLTSISGKLCLDVSTVRKEVELYLLSNNFIVIDGKRHITNKGVTILKKLGLY